MVNAVDSKSTSSDSQFKSEVGYWILYPNLLGWSNGKMQVSKTLRWEFESLTLRLPS